MTACPCISAYLSVEHPQKEVAKEEDDDFGDVPDAVGEDDFIVILYGTCVSEIDRWIDR